MVYYYYDLSFFSGISESNKLAEIIEAVKELEGAVTIDTGLTGAMLHECIVLVYF